MKHRKRDPGNGVSSSRSNISRAMRGRIPKITNFVALRNQTALPQHDSPSELVIPKQSVSSSATQLVVSTSTHGKRSSERPRRNAVLNGFESSSDSAIAAPPKRPRRAGDIKNYQPPPESIIETVQHIADQQPDEINISPIIGDVSPPAPQDPSLLDVDTPKLVCSMTVFETKNQNTMDVYSGNTN